MRTQDQSQQQDIDIFALWRGLKRSLRGLLTLTILVTLVTFGVLSLMTPRYTSEAQLAIVAKTTNPFPDGKQTGGGREGLTQRLDREAINTHVNALMAPDLLLRVANQLDLRSRSEFGASGSNGIVQQVLQMVGLSQPEATGSTDDRVLSRVQERLQVSAVTDSRFIGIRFSSSDKQLAAKFANALAETYRKSLVEVPVNETKQVVDALVPKIEQLKREVLQAESQVERFRAETDQFRTGPQSTPVNTQRMAALNTELIKAEAERSIAESKWKSAVDLSRTGNVDELPEVQSSPVMQGLIDQRVRVERQVAEAQATLLAAHPRMKQLNSDLAGVKRSIRQQVQKIVRGLEKKYRTAAFRVQDIKKEIGGLKVKVVDTSEDEARLRSLESSAKSKRVELERLQRQLEDNKTLVVTKTVPVEAQIVSMARPAISPSFPKKVPYTLLAMVATFVLGLALLTAREIIMAGSTAREELPHAFVRQPTNTSELAFEEPVRARRAPVERDPQPILQFSEPASDTGDMTIQNVADHLLQRGEEVSGFRTIVVGETHGIDASLEGMQLARHMSEAGLQVVVVDCNMDNESFADSIGLARRPGITELLVGAATFEDVITHVPNSLVHHIGLGQGANAEDFYFDGDDLNAILDALDDVYDQILVVGRYRTAQALFEAVEGRFDAGISVADARMQRSIVRGAEETFLGFEVTDIDIIRYERSELAAFTTRRQQLSGTKLEVV